MNCIPVRIRATGQVLEMVPAVAEAMIAGGTASRLDKNNFAEVVSTIADQSESMSLDSQAEQAVAVGQAEPTRKALPKRKR